IALARNCAPVMHARVDSRLIWCAHGVDDSCPGLYREPRLRVGTHEAVAEQFGHTRLGSLLVAHDLGEALDAPDGGIVAEPIRERGEVLQVAEQQRYLDRARR